MDLSIRMATWTSPAAYFPWSHVQRALDDIDVHAYGVAMETAQDMFRGEASTCSTCGASPLALLWVCVSAPSEEWERGSGRVGFLTVCTACRRQVDFLVDEELTDLEAEQREASR
jgi:hypothetical protein